MRVGILLFLFLFSLKWVFNHLDTVNDLLAMSSDEEEDDITLEECIIPPEQIEYLAQMCSG